MLIGRERILKNRKKKAEDREFDLHSDASLPPPLTYLKVFLRNSSYLFYLYSIFNIYCRKYK